MERRERDTLGERVDDPRSHRRGSRASRRAAPARRRGRPHAWRRPGGARRKARASTLEQLGRLPSARHRVPLARKRARWSGAVGESSSVRSAGAACGVAAISARPLGVGTPPELYSRAVPAWAVLPSRAGRAWPLQHALPPEPLVRNAGDVAEPALGRGGVLVEDFRGRPPRERVAVAERTAKAGEDLPVGQRKTRAGSARWTSETPRSEFVMTPSFSGHCAAGSSVVRERSGLGRVVGVLARPRVPPSPAPAAKRSASGCETTGFVATTHTAFTRPSWRASASSVDGEPGLGRDARQVGRQAPQLAHRGAVLRAVTDAVAGQEVDEAAGLAAAHRVRLAGERQRSRARAAEVPGQEAEVVKRAVLQRARRVDWLAPMDQSASDRVAPAKPAPPRRSARPGPRSPPPRARAASPPLRRARARRPRSGRDEGLVDEPVAHDHVDHRVEQREVAARAAPADGGRRRAAVGVRRGSTTISVAPSCCRRRIRAQTIGWQRRCWSRAAACSRRWSMSA